MADLVKNRHEIVFIYDVKDGNPNGDPMDENKPRMDETTGLNVVSDVRLKRTIRDYFRSAKSDVFINGEAITATKRATNILGEDPTKMNPEKISIVSNTLLEKFIDLRLFGGTLAFKSGKRDGDSSDNDNKKKKKEKGIKSITYTGPVQFRFGKSLHKVDPVFIQGTAAFTKDEESGQRSFSEKWQLPYSCIAYYGIINQNTAKETLLTDADVDFLFEAMWDGTKDLITRSKMEQLPRLLIDVVYEDEKNFHIGELDKAIELKSELEEERIRGVKDFVLEISELKGLLGKYGNSIQKVRYRIDPRLKLTLNGEPFEIEGLLEGKTEKLEK
ncbi:type I-B CRISPR-associated protein Cas7/Csh2 [Mesotoga sp. B105.6.4]|uniref:type I-B CRISPR-associated protein Cas7/Csh2 n=1 Tax=Mesotoga sp. B105.6.4 TaxID=1582224 RepID=UPI000CCBF54F|nr:type I-B CRISPR-associated protein Cas7/Csh2 [Mesotoga sp. B105.6.4]PNS37168.1 CRISPR-associated protein Csh2 [Mesotoga sp. B105.6.4]